MSDNETQEYEYRVVLQTHSGTILPLLSQGVDLNGAQERLWDILTRHDYADGWIQRRSLGTWEKLPDKEPQEEEANVMTNEEKITALTNAAADAYRATISFAYLAYVQRIRNRFQQWGNTASDMLLFHLENNGYTIAKIEQRSDDEREPSAVVVGAEESRADTEAQTG